MEETWFVLGEGRSVIRSLSSSLDLAVAIGLIITNSVLSLATGYFLIISFRLKLWMLQCVKGEPVQLIKGRTAQERNVLGAILRT